MTESTVQVARRDLVQQIAALSPDASQDEMLDVYQRVQMLKDIAREMSAMADEAMIEWINANGDIEIDTIRYYVGTRKTTKCTDNRKAMEVALNATGGDVDQLCQLLASGAWKPGACKKVLDAEAFGACFETTEQLDLKTGKPKRGLQRVDSRFIK